MSEQRGSVSFIIKFLTAEGVQPTEILQRLENSLVKHVSPEHYSVFLFLWRATYKLSSEAGCGEVTNPKKPVRERDRKSPTVFHKLHVRLCWVEYLTPGNGNTGICRAKWTLKVSSQRVIFAVTARWFIAWMVRGVLTSARFPSLAWGPPALRIEIHYSVRMVYTFREVRERERERERVENTPHNRRPRTSITPSNIDRTNVLTRNNRRIIMKELPSIFNIAVGSV